MEFEVGHTAYVPQIFTLIAKSYFKASQDATHLEYKIFNFR